MLRFCHEVCLPDDPDARDRAMQIKGYFLLNMSKGLAERKEVRKKIFSLVDFGRPCSSLGNVQDVLRMR